MENDKIPRKEIKYVINFEDYNKLYFWIKKNPKGFKKHFSPRTINNIYFDTKDFSLLNDNLAGIPNRYKIRLRWYGKNNYIETANLEIKIKNNQLGWKKRRVISINKNIKEISKTYIVKLINDSELSSDNIYLRDVSPILINQYYRDYYVSFDKKVRLTVDSKFRVFDQIKYLYLNNSIKNYYKQNLILEIKFENNIIKNIDQLFLNIPFRASRNSKYISGFYSNL